MTVNPCKVNLETSLTGHVLYQGYKFHLFGVPVLTKGNPAAASEKLPYVVAFGGNA